MTCMEILCVMIRGEPETTQVSSITIGIDTFYAREFYTVIIQCNEKEGPTVVSTNLRDSAKIYLSKKRSHRGYTQHGPIDNILKSSN